MNIRMVKGQRRWPVGRGQAQGEDITGQDVDDDTEGRKEGSLPGKHGAGGWVTVHQHKQQAGTQTTCCPSQNQDRALHGGGESMSKRGGQEGRDDIHPAQCGVRFSW